MPVHHTSVSGVGFGPGLSTVGYTVLPAGQTTGTRVTAGVVEAFGSYAASVTLDDDFIGAIVWDNGGLPPVYAPYEDVNLTAESGGGTSGPGPSGGTGATYLSVLGDLERRLGTYAALADAPSCLAWAARSTGYAPASPFVMTDDEVALVPADRFNEWLGTAEVRGLEQILVNLDDWRDVGDVEPTDRTRLTLERRLDRLRKDLEQYGVGLSAPSAGTIDLGFASPDTWGY